MSILKYLRLRSRPQNDGIPPREDGLDVVNLDGRAALRTPGNVYSELLSESGTPVNSVARVLTLTPLTTVVDGEVFGIGDYYFEFNASDGQTPSNVGANPAKAAGTVTLTGVPAAAGTLSVAGTTYTFRAIADHDAAGEIGIPASGLAADQADYISAAINGTDGINSPNAFVTARSVGSTVVITSRTVGAGGDALALTESATNLTVDGGGTLGGTVAGVDPQYFPVDITPYADKAVGTITLSSTGPVADETFVVGATTYTFKAVAAAAGQITLGDNLVETVNNIIAAINGTDGLNTANASATAAGGGGAIVVVTAKVGGVASDAIVFTEACTNTAMNGSGTLGGTTAGANPSVAEVCDAIVAALLIYGPSGSGEVPFSGSDITTAALINSTVLGAGPNAYPLYDDFAGTLVQSQAGVSGTPGVRGATMDDAANIYILRTANDDTQNYVWRKVAHSAL